MLVFGVRELNVEKTCTGSVIVVGWYLVLCRGGVVGSIVVGVGSGER